MKETTLHGWSKRASDWLKRKSKKASVARSSIVNLIGFARVQKVAEQKTKRASTIMRACLPKGQGEGCAFEHSDSNGPRLGNKVIEASGLSKAFGDKLLVEGLTFQLPPAGIVGIIGANGAGKTTLFRMIMGEEVPDAGSIEMGDTVKIGYVDQRHADIDPGKTVWEVVSEEMSKWKSVASCSTAVPT